MTLGGAAQTRKQLGEVRLRTGGGGVGDTPLRTTSRYANARKSRAMSNTRVKTPHADSDLPLFNYLESVRAHRRCPGLGDNTGAGTGGVGLSSPDYQAMI